MPRARTEYEIRAQDNASRRVRSVQRSFQDLGTSVAVLQGPLGGVAGRISSISAGLARAGPVGLAVGVALTTLSLGTIKAAKAGAALESQQGRINALLKATGGAAGLTGAEIDKMSRSLGIATLASAEGARAASAVLLTFKSITGDTFGTALKLSQDLAEVMGSDLKSSALQLGKALEDPVTGLTALKRSGVSFTSAQRDLIKSLVEGGQKAQAQGVILKTLETQIGGAGEGATQGLAGSVDTLKERWTELLEELDKTTGSGATAKSGLDLLASGLENLKRTISGREDNSEETLLSRRASLLESIAEKEAKVAQSRQMGMLNVGLMEQELAGEKARLIGIEAALRVNEDFAKTEERLSKVRQEKAGAVVKENEKEEQRNTLMDKYEKKLNEVRKALGSTTLKNQEQASTMRLLQFAYEQGSIKLDEFLELQEKLNDAQKKAAEGGVIDFFPGFVGSGTPSTPTATLPAKPEANDEEKKQTMELRKIHGVLTNLNTVAVTV